MSNKVSKQIEETVEAVEEVKDAATKVVTEKEPEMTVEIIETKKSLGEKAADLIAKYRKPVIRFGIATIIGGIVYKIYETAKEHEDDDVIEGDFDTFDDEE